MIAVMMIRLDLPPVVLDGLRDDTIVSHPDTVKFGRIREDETEVKGVEESASVNYWHRTLLFMPVQPTQPSADQAALTLATQEAAYQEPA